MNIPLNQLQARYNELPNDRRIIVVDSDGSRALFAASYLERKGYRDVGRLSGGMKKWYSELLGGEKIRMRARREILFLLLLMCGIALGAPPWADAARTENIPDAMPAA